MICTLDKADSLCRVKTILLYLFLSAIGLLLICSTVFGDEILRQELVEEYRKVLSEFPMESDNKALSAERGKLYFHLGNETSDRDYINRAIAAFEEVLDKDPGNVEVKAYLGAAYTIKARDFPLRWLANITPLGFVRIYYVNKGINLIDASLKDDAMHPVVRLVSGLTRVNLPGAFSQYKNGINDLQLLILWMEKPSLNEKYAELLADKGFIVDTYFRTGVVFFENGDKDKAETFLKAAFAMSPDTPAGKAARRRLDGAK